MTTRVSFAATRRAPVRPLRRPGRGTPRVDANRVIGEAIAGLGLPGGMLEEVAYAALDRRRIEGWIYELCHAETSTRRLRRRLEALLQASRLCPVCGKVVAARADAIYRGSPCRVEAHRAAKRRQASQWPEVWHEDFEKAEKPIESMGFPLSGRQDLNL